MANTDNETTTTTPTNGGRITDELRHYIEGSEQLYGYEYKRSRAIADHIDSEHEEALREAYMKGREDGFDRGFASADDWLAEHEGEMAEHGWVKLPKDADGEVIHLGDVVMLPDWPLNHHEVINLVYAHDGWAIISRHGSIEASEHTVHVKPKKPTVEDVLREFASAYDRIGGEDEEHQKYLNLIAEYAAKLQLRGDE